jgi:hypothetical protein
MMMEHRKKWGLFLAFLLVPGIVVTSVAVRKRFQDEAGQEGSGRHARKIVKPVLPREDLALEEARNIGPDEILRAENSIAQQSTEEADEDMGELAIFNKVGAKKATFGALSWTAGQSWQVETYYKALNNSENATWAKKPIVWQFTVRGTETIDGREVWILDLEPTDTSDMPYNPGGSVYVAIDDQSILAVRDRIQENGLVRDRFFKLEDGESSALTSFLPVDLPPVGTEGVESKSSSGMPAPNAMKPDPKVITTPTSGTVVDVEFEAEGETITQRWDKANGYWPVYSSTPSRVSYLKTGP